MWPRFASNGRRTEKRPAISGVSGVLSLDIVRTLKAIQKAFKLLTIEEALTATIESCRVRNPELEDLMES